MLEYLVARDTCGEDGTENRVHEVHVHCVSMRKEDNSWDVRRNHARCLMISDDLSDSLKLPDSRERCIASTQPCITVMVTATEVRQSPDTSPT